MRAAVLIRSALGLVLGLATMGMGAAKQNVVRVQILNKIDEELGVYWINSWKGGELVKQKDEAIMPRGSLNIDSFEGHSFLVVDENHVEGLTHYKPDLWNPKIMAFFTMGEFDLEVSVSRQLTGNLVHKAESALTRTSQLMADASKKCLKSPEVVKAAAKRKGLAAAEGSCTIKRDGSAEDEMSPEFSECLTKAVAENLAKKEGESNKNMRMLQQVGDRTRNYTCADPEMETSNTTLPAVSWKDPEGGLTYTAKVFLDEPAAKIMLLDNFATEEECKVLKEKATPHLRDATVSGGAGKATLSQARKAKAGGVPSDLNNEASVTAPLYRRGYGFANHVTGYDMNLDGQEGFSVIKYGSEDQYLSHCDGDCTGSEFKTGGRIATMVIYCEHADAGGGTTFSSSDVFVNGKKGQAVFFSYLGPDNRTDIGRTRHSGCPILEGTKWIATLWMRRGVSAEKSWEYFDPSGDPSDFARRQATGGAASVTIDAASADAKDIVVDGSQPDSSTMASAVVKETQGEGDANAIADDGRAAAAAAASTTAKKQSEGGAGGATKAAGTAQQSNGGGGGTTKAEGDQPKGKGVLSGIAGSVSGWFSSKE
ncbi:unnamed protein product [Pylaiella littoralis]